MAEATAVSSEAAAGAAARRTGEPVRPSGEPFEPPKQRFLSLQSSFSPRLRLALALLGAVLLFACWEIGAHLIPESREKFFPAVEQVLGELYILVAQDGFLVDVGWSCFRIYLAYILAISVALPLAVSMGTFANLRATLNPTLSALRYLPAASFIPLLLVWFGPTDTAKIILLFLGVIWFLVAGMLSNVLAISTDFVESALTMGARRRTVVLNVVLPATGPHLMNTARDLSAVAWTYLVIAEVVGAQSGIGAVMMRAGRFMEVDVIIAGILTIGVLGVLTDLAFRAGHRVLFPWAY